MTSFHDKPFDDGTQLKLEIFGGYIREWLPVFLTKYRNARKNFNRVNIFDFFSGPGRDTAGIAGSPLKILKELKEYCDQRGALKSSGTEVHLLFNDADPGNIARLKIEVAKIACAHECCHIEYSALPFSEAFQTQLPAIKDHTSANLVIIDQCGIKEVTSEVVQELASCRATDILFFVSSSYLRRFADVPGFVGKLGVGVEDVRTVEYNDIHRVVCEYFRGKLAGQRYYMAPFSIPERQQHLWSRLWERKPSRPPEISESLLGQGCRNRRGEL